MYGFSESHLMSPETMGPTHAQPPPSTTVIQEDVRNNADSPDLSFGVELEYKYICLDKRDPLTKRYGTPATDLGALAVHEVLSEEMHAICSTCNQDITFKLPLIGEAVRTLMQEDVYNVWTVIPESLYDGNEEAALGDKSRDYIIAGVEVRSRILSRRSDLVVPGTVSGHQHQLNYHQEISAVLSHLRAHYCAFKDNKAEEYLYANEGCGMHVHVGNYNRGYKLDDIKKIVCLNVAMERLIDQIHGPCRIDGYEGIARPLGYKPISWARDNPTMNDAYNSPWSTGFLYRAYLRRKAAKGHFDQDKTALGNKHTYPQSHADQADITTASMASDIDAWMLLVRRAPSLTDIVQNLGPVSSRDVTVNLNNLLYPANLRDNTKLTIEWRQSESTIQTDRVISYVDFVTRLVWYCQNNDWPDLLKHIDPDGALRQAEATFLDLCSVLGCDSTTIRHYRDCSTPRYIKAIRHEECRRARQLSKSGNVLADLAIRTIDAEREQLDPLNRAQVTNEKLRFGGYGLFPKSLARKLLSPDYEESDVRHITLGFNSEKQRNRKSYSPSKYEISTEFSAPSPGSSLQASPAVDAPRESAELRGRAEARGPARDPSVSPFTLSVKNEQTADRHGSSAAGPSGRTASSNRPDGGYTESTAIGLADRTRNPSAPATGRSHKVGPVPESKKSKNAQR